MLYSIFPGMKARKRERDSARELWTRHGPIVLTHYLLGYWHYVRLHLSDKELETFGLLLPVYSNFSSRVKWEPKLMCLPKLHCTLHTRTSVLCYTAPATHRIWPICPHNYSTYIIVKFIICFELSNHVDLMCPVSSTNMHGCISVTVVACNSEEKRNCNSLEVVWSQH